MENQTTFRKLRSAKCPAARRPMPTWSLVTRGTWMSGRLSVRSTAGMPRRIILQMVETVGLSERRVATMPSPFHARGW